MSHPSRRRTSANSNSTSSPAKLDLPPTGAVLLKAGDASPGLGYSTVQLAAPAQASKSG